MPVYIRKNVSFTPASIDRMSDEEDEDYLQDPDQLRDTLPQPYRMIDKVLDKILEDAWYLIQLKENKRLAEERKIRPPKYEDPNKIQTLDQATALACSADGKHLFVGLPNGLAVMDAASQQTLSQWEEDGAEITTIHAYPFTPTSSLLITIDDMAVARLFVFACDMIFFVKVLNESEDKGTKLLAMRCEASKEGDYVGIVFENPSNKEVWFETHKTPREAWQTELEAIEAKIQKQKEKEKEQKEAGEKEEQETGGDSTVEQSTEELQKSSQERSSESLRAGSPQATAAHVDTSKHKLSAGLTLVLRVRPPVPYAANASSSTFSACQKVDATGCVLGTGQTHIMSAAHLESRDSTFQHMHAGLTKYLTKDEDKKDADLITATFHFLNFGRSVMTGLEPMGQTDHPTTVALWWKGSNHLLQFSLLKVGKDVEHKPDAVWPFSGTITCTAVSPCTSHLAIGLSNGNITIWDRYMGLQRGVVNMNEKSSVQLLRFLDPCLYPSLSMDYPPYPQRTAGYVLVQYADSTQYLYDYGCASQDEPFCIGELPESDDEVQTLLETVPDLPELCLVVQKNGAVFLKDVQRGVLVCQLKVPKSFQIHSPWEPVVSFGCRGQLMFIKATGEERQEKEEEEERQNEEEPEESSETSSVFVFSLRSFAPLDRYWTRLRQPAQLQVHPTVEIRLDALMKERLAQQALRKHRLQMRWGMLRSDLAVIQNAKEVTANNNNASVVRQFMTPSSGRSIQQDILKSFKPHGQRA